MIPEIESYLNSIKNPPVIFTTKSVVPGLKRNRFSSGDLQKERTLVTHLLRANNIPGWDIRRVDKKRFIGVRRTNDV